MMNMGAERWAGIAAGLVVGLAALYYFYGPRFGDGSPAPATKQEIADAQPPSLAAQPEIQPQPPGADGAQPTYPVPEARPTAQSKQPAPQLGPSEDISASDPDVREQAAGVFGVGPVEAFLVPDRVIQNFVVTVDNLDRPTVPLKYRVTKPVPDQPLVEKAGDRLVLADDNEERYRMLAAVVNNTSAKSITDLYLRYYPLLERAYHEMGYPNAHFNDRVIRVIDHLLATPQVEGPIELVRPKVLYKYADPRLESLSAGQKSLIRIGPHNAAAVKQRLLEVRNILASGKTKAPVTPALLQQAPPAAPTIQAGTAAPADGTAAPADGTAPQADLMANEADAPPEAAPAEAAPPAADDAAAASDTAPDEEDAAP